MGQITIRPIALDEHLEFQMPLGIYAFMESPQTPELDDKALAYRKDRYTLVLFDDGRPLATANTVPMTQNIRGKVFPMGGVASVATLPQARRKGYARQIVTQLFMNMREVGQVVSSLYPFRESFYERMGYVGFPQDRVVKISPGNMSQALRFQPSGSVDFMNIADGYGIYREFMHNIQPSIHGLAIHPDSNDMRLKDNAKHWLAIARVDDEIVGIMMYRLKGIFEEMYVNYFYFNNSVGKYLLLNWLARHVDQSSAIWMGLPSNAYIETWLHDLKVEVHPRMGSPIFGLPTPMGRVVSVDSLDGIPVGEGSFTALVSDDNCDWNNAAFRFSGVDGELRVDQLSSREADCELTIQGVSALVYGTHAPEDFYYRGWGDPEPETQQIMSRMFPRANPWLHAAF